MSDLRFPSMSRTESLVMDLLGDRDRYGLELVEASSGALKRGSVYVILARMEEKGFITSRLEEAPPEAGGLPRRLYEPTAFGRRVLSAYEHVVRHLTPEPAR